MEHFLFICLCLAMSLGLNLSIYNSKLNQYLSDNFLYIIDAYFLVNIRSPI